MFTAACNPASHGAVPISLPRIETRAILQRWRRRFRVPIDRRLHRRLCLSSRVVHGSSALRSTIVNTKSFVSARAHNRKAVCTLAWSSVMMVSTVASVNARMLS